MEGKEGEDMADKELLAALSDMLDTEIKKIALGQKPVRV